MDASTVLRTLNSMWAIEKNDDVRPTCPTYRIAPIGMLHVINELNSHIVTFTGRLLHCQVDHYVRDKYATPIL